MNSKSDFVHSRKVIYFLAYICYLLWGIFLLVRFKGYYAFDELYHISSCDWAFDASSVYDRAPYVNFTIKILSAIFGKSYYTYKMMPLILGNITVIILLYLVYQLSESKYAGCLFVFMMGTYSLLVWNHFYVRMYVWDECIVAILALIFYKLSQVHSIIKKLLLHLLFAVVAMSLFLFQTKEESSIAVLAVGILAWIINYLGIWLIPYLRKKRLLLPCVVITAGVCIFMLACSYMIRHERLQIPAILARFYILFHTVPIGTSYWKFVIGKGLLFTISLVGFGCVLLKKELHSNILGIYMLGAIPFLTYGVLYYNQAPFRVFVAYMPIMVLVVVLWFEKLPKNKVWLLGELLAVVVTIVLSYPDVDIVGFYRIPSVSYETSFNDYGGLIRQAEEEMRSGRKCIAAWANTHHLAAFDFGAEYAFALDDSDNQSLEYTEAQLQSLLDYFETTTDQYVFLIGTHTFGRLDDRCPGFMQQLMERYPYKEFAMRAYLFYIN